MAPSPEAMVAELWARDLLARVPVTYARGIDRRDWALVRSCFADDAMVEGSRASAPVEAYLADLRLGVEFFPTTMHFMGNQIVELEGDVGRVETYAVAYHWKAEQAGAEHPDNLIVGVRYHDTLVRSGERWVISHRHVDPDWRVGPYPQT